MSFLSLNLIRTLSQLQPLNHANSFSKRFLLPELSYVRACESVFSSTKLFMQFYFFSTYNCIRTNTWITVSSSQRERCSMLNLFRHLLYFLLISTVDVYVDNCTVHNAKTFSFKSISPRTLNYFEVYPNRHRWIGYREIELQQYKVQHSTDTDHMTEWRHSDVTG